jgi:hypothetical protein
VFLTVRKCKKPGVADENWDCFKSIVFYRGFVCVRKLPWICVQTSFPMHFLTFCRGGAPRSKDTCALFYAFLRALASMGSVLYAFLRMIRMILTIRMIECMHFYVPLIICRIDCMHFTCLWPSVE